MQTDALHFLFSSSPRSTSFVRHCIRLYSVKCFYFIFVFLQEHSICDVHRKCCAQHFRCSAKRRSALPFVHCAMCGCIMRWSFCHDVVVAPFAIVCCACAPPIKRLTFSSFIISLILSTTFYVSISASNRGWWVENGGTAIMVNKFGLNIDSNRELLCEFANLIVSSRQLR